ncbi:hypothetical protein BLNAU_11263 [Blattamonas nauphoetae]|uniref:Uncharacterized protein n=1 Tax=Blattamonas nauphoetae TaxID=2049346 RepID=A0ABQ9XMU3_9EUKA|nr:hypothetical protein BLNAU_11263 [Blattamonas nauphoetae]
MIYMPVLVKSIIPLSLIRFKYPAHDASASTFEKILTIEWKVFDNLQSPSRQQIEEYISSTIIEHELYTHFSIKCTPNRTSYDEFRRIHSLIKLLHTVSEYAQKQDSAPDYPKMRNFNDFSRLRATDIVNWIKESTQFEFLTTFKGTSTNNEEERILRQSLKGISQFVSCASRETMSIFPVLFVSVASTLPAWNTVERDELTKRKNTLRFLEVLVFQVFFNELHNWQLARDLLERDDNLSLDPDLFNIIDSAIQNRPKPPAYDTVNIEELVDKEEAYKKRQVPRVPPPLPPPPPPTIITHIPLNRPPPPPVPPKDPPSPAVYTTQVTEKEPGQLKFIKRRKEQVEPE